MEKERQHKVGGTELFFTYVNLCVRVCVCVCVCVCMCVCMCACVWTGHTSLPVMDDKAGFSKRDEETERQEGRKMKERR